MPLSFVVISRFLRNNRTILALKMDSKASQLVADAETNVPGMELQHIGEFDEAKQTFAGSLEQARTDAESGSVAAQAEKQQENVHGPKGVRFALLFTCILLGCFCAGYVRVDQSQERCPS
jgi:hypothetical protein